jgi:cytoplasmic iron level regulating protein YaaA (DUF328/UPF0246 family)
LDSNTLTLLGSGFKLFPSKIRWSDHRGIADEWSGYLFTMITLLSPSKSMNLDRVRDVAVSQPTFLDQAEVLVEGLRPYSVVQIQELMEVSEAIAELNQQRFQDWKRPFTRRNSKQAVLAFSGDVYEGLDAGSLDKRELRYAHNNLRILSGLYGLLRPLDLIQPYRLEMGRSFANSKGRNLYEFWGSAITEQINDVEKKVVVNLASQEYFQAVKESLLVGRVVTPVFKDGKDGSYKVISFFAKKARGMMARFIVENRIKTVSGLKAFCAEGYVFDKSASTKDTLVFCRSGA